MGFRKQLISFDDAGYKETVEKANGKIDVFKQALEFAEQYIVVFDKERFANGFVQFFKDEFEKLHSKQNTLDLAIDKLLFVKDVDISTLQQLDIQYQQDPTVVSFDTPDGLPTAKVDKEPFQKWTTSQAENDKLALGKLLIETIQNVSEIQKVYPFDVCRGTSHFIGYDIRKNKYFVNV